MVTKLIIKGHVRNDPSRKQSMYYSAPLGICPGVGVEHIRQFRRAFDDVTVEYE